MKPAKKSSPKLLPPDLYGLTEADKKRFGEESDLGMVAPDSPVLRRRAAAVRPKDIQTGRIQGLASRLLEAANSQQRGNLGNKRRRTLVGLAAPQIGESLRIIVVDTEIGPDRKNPGHLECFINPKITWRSKETEEMREGCFSAGPVWGLVRRPLAIKLTALTVDGEKIEREYKGFTARIFQHEVDHLNGIRFPDRIRSDRKRHWVHAEEILLYPERVHDWPRICSKERWVMLKQGKI